MLESLGLRVIVYIDDSIYTSPSESEAEKGVVSDLDRAGFMLNVMKSQLISSTDYRLSLIHLRLREGCFRVPQHKIDRLKSAIANIYTCTCTHVC